MNQTISYILTPVFIGIGATLIFDLWAVLLNYAFKIAPSNFCLVGRWLRYMPEGVFIHSNIGSAPRKSGECTAGWLAHYFTGVAFAAMFIAFAGNNWIQHPGIFPALLFGIITLAAPFFIMQPAFGLGFAASKTPKPAQARLRSLMNHIVFGFGLYLFGLLAKWLTMVLAS